jgi:hypothetical protein
MQVLGVIHSSDDHASRAYESEWLFLRKNKEDE